MLKAGTLIKFSARVLACDTDGNVYLFLGDDERSVSQYQWGFAANQNWFDNVDDVMNAIKFCDQETYRNYKIVPNSVELIRYTAETVIESITKIMTPK